MEKQNICQAQDEVAEVNFSTASISAPRNTTSSCSASIEQSVEVVAEDITKQLRRRVATLEVELKKFQGKYNYEKNTNAELRDEVVVLKTSVSEKDSALTEIQKELKKSLENCEQLVHQNDKLVNQLNSSQIREKQVSQEYEEQNKFFEISKPPLDDFLSAYLPIWERRQQRAKKGEAESESVNENLEGNGQGSEQGQSNTDNISPNRQENSKIETTPNNEVPKRRKRPNTRAQDMINRKSQKSQQEDCTGNHEGEQPTTSGQVEGESPLPKKNGQANLLREAKLTLPDCYRSKSNDEPELVSIE